MSREPDGPIDLVTGATGMLGSHIAESLVARGRRVRASSGPGATPGSSEAWASRSSRAT